MARLDEVDLLITNEAASVFEVEALRSAGLEVRLAPEAREPIP